MGDFLLEGTANAAWMRAFYAACDRWNLENNNPHNRYSVESRMTGLRIPISPSRSMNYQQGEVYDLSRVRENFQLNMGLSGFSIPISWSPITGANGVFKDLSTTTDTQLRTGFGRTDGGAETSYIEHLRTFDENTNQSVVNVWHGGRSRLSREF